MYKYGIVELGGRAKVEADNVWKPINCFIQLVVAFLKPFDGVDSVFQSSVYQLVDVGAGKTKFWQNMGERVHKLQQLSSNLSFRPASLKGAFKKKRKYFICKICGQLWCNQRY